MRYRRLKVDGATYFFTLVTFERRPMFASRTAVELLSSVIAEVCARHFFTIDAQVILPDHLHALWAMPERVSDYAKRWSLIKATFSRSYARTMSTPARDLGRRRKREQTVWQRAFGSTSLATRTILTPTSTIFTTTR
jgi:putative transposase